MRGIFLFGVISLLFIWGFRSPIVFVLGYVWASIFTPQLVAYSIIPSIPVSFIFALFAFGAFLLSKKFNGFRWRSQSVLTAVFAVWMTTTLLWAVVPINAYTKWDWAIKSIVFTTIIPFFIRNRQDLEAVIWTILMAGMAHCISFGTKVILSGGGYNMALGLVGGNTGYGEGSTLAMFSVSLIPMAVYLYFHQTLVPQRKLIKIALGTFIVFLLLTAIGTYARTGVICLLTLGLCIVYYGRRRLLSVIFVAILGGIAYPFMEADWISRMSTIQSDVDSSAMGRVAVWKWVVEYVLSHPFGGSFEMFRISRYSMMLSDGSILEIASKAYHNIYIEVLGEGGIPGFVMFFVLIIMTLKAFVGHKNALSRTGEVWLGDIGRYLLISSLVYLAGGMFIGVAFQSYFYYLVALSAAYLNLVDIYGRV